MFPNPRTDPSAMKHHGKLQQPACMFVYSLISLALISLNTRRQLNLSVNHKVFIHSARVESIRGEEWLAFHLMAVIKKLQKEVIRYF